MKIREATLDDHKECCRVMKLYRPTQHFSHMFYSSKERYDRGDILVAVIRGKIRGVACVSYRSRKYQGRERAANLQFLAVELRGEGIGSRLVATIARKAPDNRIELKVEKSNLEAIAAYTRMGFKLLSSDTTYNLMIREGG